MLDYENKFKNSKYRLIAGIDEAGRGPLAGPVVCACAVMDPEYINDEINDSKQLTAKARDRLYDEIIKNAVSFSVSVTDNKVIDDINILNATKKGMYETVEKLSVKPDIVLVDAVKLVKLELPTEAIIKGDELSFNIAAASILAKVTRDRIMEDYDKVYPQYLFAEHKGYGTKKHIELIRKYGATEIHRKTFLKNIFETQIKLFE
jgi:ribonuclease HII